MNNTQTTVFKSELLESTAEMIRAAGYDIYYSIWEYSPGKPTYFHFTDGVNIGYCQEGYFGGICFSSVHKPSREAGTGFGLSDDPGTFEPNIRDAKKALLMKTPLWFNNRKFTPIKYTSWNEYTTKNSSCKYVKF